MMNILGGKCSICGEAYNAPTKLFDKGGPMYLGKIVKTYTQGQQIDVNVVVSRVLSNRNRSFHQ